MADYVEHGGRSRGSVLYTDPTDRLPVVGPNDDRELDLPEDFRFTLDGGALDDEIQEVTLAGGEPRTTWRPRRPIPADDDFFENVWREFRETGNIR